MDFCHDDDSQLQRQLRSFAAQSLISRQQQRASVSSSSSPGVTATAAPSWTSGLLNLDNSEHQLDIPAVETNDDNDPLGQANCRGPGKSTIEGIVKMSLPCLPCQACQSCLSVVEL